MIRTTPIFLGQYRPLESFLHRLDARAKLLPVLAVLVLALLTTSVLFYGIVLGALITGLLLSKVGPGNLWRNFRPVLLLVLITFLYHILFSGKEGPVLFTIDTYPVTSRAMANAVFFSLRLVLFIGMAFLITLTNSPSELAETVTFLMKPLGRLGVPVNDLGLIVFIAMRFIPILYDEFVSIRNAQMMRGVNFGGSYVRRIRRTTVLLIPVFASAMNRADDLALAIEARGYHGHAPRTAYTHARFGKAEYSFMLAGTATILALFSLTR
ncbi:MAG: energy-coupling factor transporter transmembrane component T [Candidatus Zixiibacteriota bacterium]